MLTVNFEHNFHSKACFFFLKNRAVGHRFNIKPHSLQKRARVTRFSSLGKKVLSVQNSTSVILRGNYLHVVAYIQEQHGFYCLLAPYARGSKAYSLQVIYPGSKFHFLELQRSTLSPLVLSNGKLIYKQEPQGKKSAPFPLALQEYSALLPLCTFCEEIVFLRIL